MSFADKFVAETLALQVALYQSLARLEARTGSEALHDLRIAVRRIRSSLRPIRSLLRRLALRSGACIVCCASAMILLFGVGLSIWTAGSLCCLTAIAGADVAIGFYERWVAKRLDLSDAEPKA